MSPDFATCARGGVELWPVKNYQRGPAFVQLSGVTKLHCHLMKSMDRLPRMMHKYIQVICIPFQVFYNPQVKKLLVYVISKVHFVS